MYVSYFIFLPFVPSFSYFISTLYTYLIDLFLLDVYHPYWGFSNKKVTLMKMLTMQNSSHV